MMNAVAADVMFSQVLSIVEKRMETLRYDENCSGKWLTYANEVLQSNGVDMHYF